MNSIAMPRRVWRSFISLRIWACTVTSSAVVGFVGDQQIGAVGERHRDHHPLALAARKLVRIGAEALRRIDDADLRQKLDDAFVGRRVASLVQRDDLADLMGDGVERIERGHRLLEHHRHADPAHLAQVRVRHLQDIAAAKQNFSARIARSGLRQKADDRLRGDGLARTGFAHQRQRLALLEPERNISTTLLRPSPCAKAIERSRTSSSASLTGTSFADRKRRAPPRR